MFGFHKEIQLTTQRLLLRPPRRDDWESWAQARRTSAKFLKPWEPVWSADHLTKGAFHNRVYWARRAIKTDRAYPFFLLDVQTEDVVGGVTLDNVRRGPAQIATLGYWIDQKYCRRGLMSEALSEMIAYAFGPLKFGRIEAGALAENDASCALLKKLDFVEEGQARAYLKINGEWRDHTLFALLNKERALDVG
jgi:ribosomal-protein-alanine N-acetyltransferase